MIVAMVAPLGRRSSPGTRACFEFARLVCSPLPAACGTLDEACTLVVRPRLRFDMPKTPLNRTGAHGAHHPNPAEVTRRWRGRGASRPGSLSVTTTDALFVGKVQRKREQWYCWIGRRQIISAENRGNSCQRKHPAEILALRRELRIPKAAAQTRIVSKAGIRLIPANLCDLSRG
jgi:hypothetical protein